MCLPPNKILHSMKGLVLVSTADKCFELNHILVKEIKKYCLGNGLEIDRVVFFSNFEESGLKSNNTGLVMSNSDSYLYVVKNGDELVAHVFLYAVVNINGEE